MPKKHIPTRSFVLLAILAGLLLSAGCEQPKQIQDTSMLVQGPIDVEPVEPGPVVLSPEQRQAEAVSLYVDAMMLNDLNEREQAIRKLSQALELDPKFAIAYSLKGDILQGMEQFEDSADAYEQATVYDPWSFKDFFNLGKVCQVIKQWARAAKAYTSACQLDPQHYLSHLGAAQSYFELKEYDHSLAYAQAANKLDPNQSDPILLLGDVFEAQEDHLLAINSYRRALELEGNDPAIMVALGRAYLRSGRFSSAKELLIDVTKTDPNSSIAYQYLGFAQLKLKETDAAIESYRHAVAVDENDWMARKGLGVAYMLTTMNSPANKERAQALALEQWNLSLQIKPDQPKLKQLVNRYSR